ncbi:hypothetical protein KDW_45420 [Dictyobacter vulcani]|uniref:ATP-grasp domain-containing protein n=1 Tax=Dictyobacter vulcani TaxID=2607529 RepID=A0A5J4KV36_9CHLR|nr:hypothetical protein [Dictyobacter vulcani]GER90380.1 hypothetical protein KDW_45420 [Dictyobacter vulcani]
MNILDTSVFALDPPARIGVGFHNIGSGLLRASHPATIRKVEAHYGERCGHLPLNVENLRILVTTHNEDINSQIAYLSALLGKDIRAITASELRQEQQEYADNSTLVVPYINTPESQSFIHNELAARAWGLPAAMVHLLKNKADFYNWLDNCDLSNFQAPDYRIAHIENLSQDALQFLKTIEEIISEAGLPDYPPGIMLRAAESDGNYGCCLLYATQKHIILIPNGEPTLTRTYTSWPEALEAAQQILLETMDSEKETRIVMSRYLDLIDSPGMSAVISAGQVESLRWNGQLQAAGSKACIGTSNYIPKNANIAQMQETYEEQTIACFEQLLKQTARHLEIDFQSIRGVANIDIMLPGPLEEALQRRRGQQPVLYIAECNSRWTNYTDAILSVIGANRQTASIQAMRDTIQNRIQTIDRYYFPTHIPPAILRQGIAEKDEQLKASGTRIICRMTKQPMGIIFAGDLERAQQELTGIIQHLTT